MITLLATLGVLKVCDAYTDMSQLYTVPIL